VTGDKVEIWAPTQNGEASLTTAAQAAGVPTRKRHGPQADDRRRLRPARRGAGLRALCSADRQGGRGAGEDRGVARTGHVPRPLSAGGDEPHDRGLDAEGRLTALQVRLAGHSILATLTPFALANRADLQFQEGFLEDMPYDVAALSRRLRDAQHACAGRLLALRQPLSETASFARASSTNWRMQRTRTPIAIAARARRPQACREIHGRARRGRRARANGARRCRPGCNRASRSTRLRHIRCGGSARLRSTPAQGACTASWWRSIPAPWSTR